jgi:serine O-acetyltransferase
MDRVVHGLADQIQRGLMVADATCSDCGDRAQALARTFLARLPEVRRLLATDIQAGFEGDPAATSPEEVLFSYPGLLAVTNQRLAHELLKLGVPLLPRMITEHAHSLTGIDIHPGAQIGERFFIDHGTGVVIGETCIIGRNVRIYQGVTLGAKSFPLDANGHPIKGVPRHPVVEDDVIVYSNATILGRITLGKGSAIGGNVWLTRSVPPGSVITQANEKDGMPS